MLKNQDTDQNLNDYSFNVFSQTGEDGIIEKILDILSEKDKWCVEFGAWDGKLFSNTCNLIMNKDYYSVQIEGNQEKYKELCNTYQNKNVICNNQFVGFDKNNNLDTILSETDIPQNFDFLSIDVDGNDYHIWSCMEKYRPKLVCVEYNPTIPNEVEFVQEKNINVNQGASILSFVKLAQSKEYELICATMINAFFIDRKYFKLFNIANNSINNIRQDKSCVTYLYSGYDGTIFIEGAKRLPWHKINLKEENFQIIPKSLRVFPSNYNKQQRRLFNIFKNFLKLNFKKFLGY